MQTMLMNKILYRTMRMRENGERKKCDAHIHSAELTYLSVRTQWLAHTKFYFHRATDLNNLYANETVFVYTQRTPYIGYYIILKFYFLFRAHTLFNFYRVFTSDLVSQKQYSECARFCVIMATAKHRHNALTTSASSSSSFFSVNNSLERGEKKAI